MPKINVGRFEGYVRAFLGTGIIVLGSHGMWYLVPLGLIVLWTGLSWYCPISKSLNIGSRAAKENYYLSYLPLYNPEPLFIFFGDGKLAFENKRAKEVFPNISAIADLIFINEDEISTSIDENIFSNIKILGDDDHTYSVTLKGSKEIDAIIAYVHDVTDLIKLDQEIISTQKEIVYTMGEIGETRSMETGHHVRRVAEYSYLLAKLYGLTEEEAALLKLASPMHDIGKIATPDAILNKPGKLTADEFEIMKRHATVGYEMLDHSTRPILKTAAIVAGEHHEKWDGSGYPHGNSGEDIHIFGRITALADVFDALGSTRVYKDAWPLEEIIELINKEKGGHFDPELVTLFLGELDQFLEIRNTYRDK
ncbi:HD domain-containing phosphohydrolase [Desulfosediminicola flagellatus]|uniref:HD domain-containing phosphohydrolase n=1 Tax=Desulfosediminicola flagellatus TaxID=2569541 RepID=UPI0010AC7594|nr:HD domain-containing phosphohydrolase [Desulfosediminicola flagellatus]